MGNYLSMAVSFVSLILLLRLNFGFTLIEDLLTTFGLVALAAFLGYLHLLKQQDTDAILANQAVIDEIVRRLKP